MTTRLKHLAQLVTSCNSSDIRPYVALEHLEPATGLLGRDAEPPDLDCPDAGAAAADPGDVLFGKLRPYLAKTWLVDRPTYASTELLCLRPADGVVPGWYRYLMASKPVVEWAVATSDGSKMPRTSWEWLGEYISEIPPVSQQHGVADYLDIATTHLDTLIEKQRQMISLLDERFESMVFYAVTRGLEGKRQLKESGLPWTGEIPIEWKTPTVAANFDLQLGKMLNDKATSGPNQYPYLRNANVQWDRVDLDDLASMHFDAADRRRYELRPGDLLVCEGGEVGRAAVWQGETPDCYFQKAIHRVRPRSNTNGRYLMYCLRAAAKRSVFAIEGNLSTIAHLTQDQLRVYRFPWPPFDEQARIVSRLDEISHWTTKARNTLSRQLGLLSERRQALITAAVTGELDIPGAGT